MARTRGAARREKQAVKRPAPQEASECDSTVRQWGRVVPPARKHRRTRGSSSGEGVPWADMPENALYKVFESLLQDKQAPAVSECSMGIA
jgi:hypothetical protein